MNIGTLFTKTAKSYPDKLAISYGNKEWTYAEANGRINRLANAFARLGIKKGEHIAILQFNCPQTIETLFACFKAGLCAVPINWRLHPNEYSFIIDHSDSVAVVFTEDFRDSLHSLRGDMPKVEHYICLCNAKEDMLNYEELIESQSPDFNDTEISIDDLAWIFYTSGTTGRPKGAMLTHGNLLTMTMNFFADVSPLGPQDAILHAAPLSHGSGLYAIPNIAKAANNVILETKSFEPKAIFETIQRRKITFMFAAPTMLKMLVSSPEMDNYDIGSLKCLIYGGGPMYAEDLKEAVKKLGQVLVQGYGQAESPMTITYLRKEEHLLEGTEDEMRRLNSAGIARTDVEVRIFDENDNEVPIGTSGEVVVRGEVVMKGYWKDKQATERTLRGGWLHTGDIGYMDDKGYVFLLDRSKDMLISGGENIYPREIEDVIIRHPAIHEVAVIGIPDDKWGEAIKAIVSLKSGMQASEQEIIDFCKDNLASYKKPKSVDFMAELPKNSYGKILKRELRDKYWKGQERRIR
jgi:acyl-CoA synthetase (AMP-forming)/AMP-acid ligase II